MYFEAHRTLVVRAFTSVCGSILIKQLLVLTSYLCCSISWFTHIILTGISTYVLNLNQRPIVADSYLFGFSVEVWVHVVFQGITCETNKRWISLSMNNCFRNTGCKGDNREDFRKSFWLYSSAFGSIRYFVTIWTAYIPHFPPHKTDCFPLKMPPKSPCFLKPEGEIV